MGGAAVRTTLRACNKKLADPGLFCEYWHYLLQPKAWPLEFSETGVQPKREINILHYSLKYYVRINLHIILPQNASGPYQKGLD